MISRFSAIALLAFGAACSSSSGGTQPRCADDIATAGPQVEQIQDETEKKATQAALEAAKRAAAVQDEALCEIHVRYIREVRSHIR